MESFCQAGCNVFFIGSDSRMSIKFFKDLYRFYFFTVNNFFYRGLLSNDSGYKFSSKFLPNSALNIQSRFLLDNLEVNWENYFFLFSNFNLISNSKKNIFLIFGHSYNFVDYNAVLNKNNILVFVGFVGINLFYEGYRLFLDFSNENTFKYLQFLIFFLLNFFSLDEENYLKFSSFCNVYSILKWKKMEWYSSSFFFNQYKSFSFFDLNNFLKLNSKKCSLFFVEKFVKFQNWFNSFYFFFKFKYNFFEGFKFNLFFFNFFIKNKYYFFFWNKSFNFWFFFYIFRFYNLKNYKSFLLKFSLSSLFSSFIFGFLPTISGELSDRICLWKKSLINNYLQNVYYFKNLKILDLNYIYGYFFFCKFFYDCFFLGRSFGDQNFIWDDFSVLKFSQLVLKINKLKFYMLNLKSSVNFLLTFKIFKKLIFFYSYKFMFYILSKQWFLMNFSFFKNDFIFWNQSHFFSLWRAIWRSLKFEKLIFSFLMRFFFKGGRILQYNFNFNKVVLYYPLVRNRVFNLFFFWNTKFFIFYFKKNYWLNLINNFFKIKNKLQFFFYFKKIRFKFNQYRFLFFFFYFYFYRFCFFYKHRKALGFLKYGYFFYFLKNKVFFINNFRWRFFFFINFLFRVFNFLDVTSF